MRVHLDGCGGDDVDDAPESRGDGRGILADEVLRRRGDSITHGYRVGYVVGGGHAAIVGTIPYAVVLVGDREECRDGDAGRRDAEVDEAPRREAAERAL